MPSAVSIDANLHYEIIKAAAKVSNIRAPWSCFVLDKCLSSGISAARISRTTISLEMKEILVL